MAYDGMYGPLSTRGTVNDILNEALDIQALLVPLSVTVQNQAATVAAAYAQIAPVIPLINQASTDAANTVILAAQAASNAMAAQYWAGVAEQAATQQPANTYLRRSNNLSDLTDPAAARTNLGLTGNYQTASAALTSIAGLATVANRMIYTTGTDTYAVMPAPSYGRSLVGSSSAVDARTTLGLGTAALSAVGDFQGTNTKLTNFLAAASGTETLVYNTGATTYGVQALGAYGKSLIGLATSDPLKTSLGLPVATVLQDLVIKSWGVFDGTVSSGGFLSGSNVQSLTKTSAGKYQVTFTTAFANSGQIGLVGSGHTDPLVPSSAVYPLACTFDTNSGIVQTASSVGIIYGTGTTSTITPADKKRMNFQFYGFGAFA